jgi:hypothetical protein
VRPRLRDQSRQAGREARYDGIFVLRTNARISPLQAVLRYRDLLQIEDLQTFCAISTVSSRPPSTTVAGASPHRHHRPGWRRLPGVGVALSPKSANTRPDSLALNLLC